MPKKKGSKPSALPSFVLDWEQQGDLQAARAAIPKKRKTEKVESEKPDKASKRKVPPAFKREDHYDLVEPVQKGGSWVLKHTESGKEADPTVYSP